MADIEALKRALINADKAGDADAARVLAGEIRKQMSGATGAAGTVAPVAKTAPASKPAPATAQRNTYNPAMGGFLMGFDDEVSAAMLTPIEAVKRRVMGQPRASVGESYTDLQQRFDSDKQAYRKEKPIRAMVGEIGGGLGSAAMLGTAGLTTIGRGSTPMARTAMAMGEGAAYGGVVGAGEARPGERMEGAAEGAIFGGATAGILSGAGEVAGRVAALRKAAKAPAPTIDDLSAAADQFYTLAEQSGAAIKPTAMRRLAMDVKVAADKFNDRLRPQTLGVARDFVRLLDGQPVTLREFDEFRQVVGNAMDGASKDDRRTLMRIKNALDKFGDNIQQTDVLGDAKGFDFIKDARAVYARKSKAEIIERMLDVADVNTGQYTQSSSANTIRREFAKLYKNEAKMRAFNAEERRVIREIAKGNTSGPVVRLLSKFAPRGVVSILSGVMTGSAAGSVAGGPLGVVGGAVLPVVGHLAGEAADKSVIGAAQSAQNLMARGGPAPLPAIQNRLALGAPVTSQEASRLRAR